MLLRQTELTDDQTQKGVDLARRYPVLPHHLALRAYSGPSLPPIPLQACHPFHSKAATDSGEACHPETGA